MYRFGSKNYFYCQFLKQYFSRSCALHSYFVFGPPYFLTVFIMLFEDIQKQQEKERVWLCDDMHLQCVYLVLFFFVCYSINVMYVLLFNKILILQGNFCVHKREGLTKIFIEIGVGHQLTNKQLKLLVDTNENVLSLRTLLRSEDFFQLRLLSQLWQVISVQVVSIQQLQLLMCMIQNIFPILRNIYNVDSLLFAMWGDFIQLRFLSQLRQFINFVSIEQLKLVTQQVLTLPTFSFSFVCEVGSSYNTKMGIVIEVGALPLLQLINQNYQCM
eukprot:TRINITY_DN9074_c0_g1_i12.p3 TRINITY_DN9074_c0_g1~~TRINITY_DN9074_c0_g1_i12.p3  ORF type:complete len:272 (+),score=-1.86 TRINITY_DN9074_c0_g1_i12:944-1759(+)